MDDAGAAQVMALQDGELGRGVDQAGVAQVAAEGGRGSAGGGVLDDATDRERVARVPNPTVPFEE